MTDQPAPPTVLLAEDHDGLREALVTMLESAGFGVLGASSNGADLVKLARSREADVVLVDLRMPSLNGIDTARWIKSISPATPVVVYSAYGDDAFQQAAMEAGVFAYLIKGCPPATLISTLRAAVEQRRSAGR
jgi:DNA-binding NarL/FixJ family response regulator